MKHYKIAETTLFSPLGGVEATLEEMARVVKNWGMRARCVCDTGRLVFAMLDNGINVVLFQVF